MSIFNSFKHISRSFLIDFVQILYYLNIKQTAIIVSSALMCKSRVSLTVSPKFFKAQTLLQT